MARATEQATAAIIEKVLGIQFTGRRSLGPWGQTDGAADLGNGHWVSLEVETTQKHPCTNVLKLWPYLEEHQADSVVLVHVFRVGASNESSSRGNLASWIAGRMMADLGSRFRYFRLMVADDGAVVGPVQKVRAALQPAQQAFRAGGAK